MVNSMNNNPSIENLVEILALLSKKLNKLYEQGKRVTVHIETKFHKVHQDFEPEFIQVDINNGQISIDYFENGEVSWFFDLNDMFWAIIDGENETIKFRTEQREWVVFQF